MSNSKGILGGRYQEGVSRGGKGRWELGGGTRRDRDGVTGEMGGSQERYWKGGTKRQDQRWVPRERFWEGVKEGGNC